MIVTVTLNAAVDKTFQVPGFGIGRVYRPTSARIVAGGKGINVARVYRTLGGEAHATGFVGGAIGMQIRRGLVAEGMPHSFVRIECESRECIAVIDPETWSQTEVNENGPEVSCLETAAVSRRVRSLCRRLRPEWLVISGSAPPGVPVDTYASMCADAQRLGIRVAVDASGDLLRCASEAGPDLLKPNNYELASIAGCDPDDDADLREAARLVVDRGVGAVALTLGGRGSVYMDRTGGWAAQAPTIRFVSAVGSGDAYLAALLWAMGKGSSAPECLRLAVGAGSANAEVSGAGFCSAEHIMTTAGRTQVTVLLGS